MPRWACSCLHGVLPGEDVNKRNSVTGRTLLHMAAADGEIYIARMLLKAGADKDAGGKNGRAPIYHAVASNHTHLATLLIGACADLDAQDNRGWTPLHYRGYSKLRTHTAVGPYGRSIPRSIGPS